MYEYPPILTGSEQQQLQAIRDYLVRLARSLDEAALAAEPKSPQSTEQKEESIAAIRQNAANLRALVVKTAQEAETVAQELGETRHELESSYLAKSDFGAYMEQAQTSFAATARGVVDSYDFQALIDAVSAHSAELDSYLTSIRGEIRRGIITDPGTGEQALGIAIAENLQFTGAVHREDGLDYYELAPGQTLGLYTATGWQFWVNGSKRGWFAAADGSLHVVSEVVEDKLQIGSDWLLSAVGGLGIKYVGG